MTNPNLTDASNNIDMEPETDATDAHLDGLPSYQSLSEECEIVQPQTLITNGVLIFPSEPPANALYQLSRDLVAGTRISISRIDHEIHTSPSNVPTARVKDRLVYTFSHRIFDDSSIEMTGRRRDSFRLLLISRVLWFHEERWFVSFPATAKSNSSFVLRCRHTNISLPGKSYPYRWYDTHDKLIAVEDQSSQNCGPRSTPVANPFLRIIIPLDQKLMDVLVASWCARIWNHNLRGTGQIKTISKGKNASFKGGS